MKNKKPPTNDSAEKKLDIDTQNPVRSAPRFYNDARPGYGVEEITGVKVFRTQNDFKDDSDDDEEISAQLTEAGVNEPQNEPEADRDDAIEEDREFELRPENSEGFEDDDINDDDEVDDLHEI